MPHRVSRRAVLPLLACPAVARAQGAWPNGPIRLVVPFAPGSQPDLMGRLVADPLGAALGVPVVVENRPGVAGNLGTEAVIRARPDGQTLLFGTVNNAINQTFFRPAFDWLRDLGPIAAIYMTPNVVLVNAALPASSLADLVALAKDQPGRLNFASSGSGTSLHLAGELLNQIAGIAMVHVPYRAAAAAAQDLEAGRVQVMFDNLAPALARIEGGRVRALATTAPVRSSRLPDMPTAAEAGFPGLTMLIWGGLFAPARTPPAVMARLSAECADIVASPALAARLDALGSVAPERDRGAFRAFTVAETERWGHVVTLSGAKPD
ncbi:Bug family tripartite tricarboxylate transporter substrate binding protein [Roseomonas sp. CCTCC AB2023176]|uniref:Bug family tripartite tricarboxylate transporter substrate binding protein n=1 Tax=Roseomonas sp. CCTCC AB2023176 TaxID=3342640 RepID=UPI0035DFD983